jgi:hypothetical protein
MCGRTVDVLASLDLIGIRWTLVSDLKKVYVIAVNANDIGEANLMWIKMDWCKKNDIIITFGGTNVCKPSWCSIRIADDKWPFVRKTLSLIILKHGLTNDTHPHDWKGNI